MDDIKRKMVEAKTFIFWMCCLASKVKREKYPDFECDCICHPTVSDIDHPTIDGRIIDYIWGSVHKRLIEEKEAKERIQEMIGDTRRQQHEKEDIDG